MTALWLAALMAATAPSEPTWKGTLEIEACTSEVDALPGQAELALDATLLLRARDGIGSAVVISPDGFALTAAHVVAGQRSLTGVSRRGSSVKVTVVRVDERNDVALIKADVEAPSPCLRPYAERALIGSDVFVLGSPAGEELSFSVAKGIISGYRSFAGARFVQLDASLNPGNSGGPVVNAEGFVVAIASWKVSHVAVEGLSFGVPVNTALTTLEVEEGTQSSADWAKRRGYRPLHTTPEPKARPPDKDLMRRQEIKRDLIISGAILLGFGVTAIVPTGAAAYTRDSIGPGAWKVMTGINAAGWALGGIGAGLLTAGLVIPKRRRRRMKNVAVLPGPERVVLSGRF